MNKTWGSLIVAAVAVAGPGGCTQDATLSADALAPVKVGLITSLSGGLASLGPGWVETARTAEVEVRAAGGPLVGRNVEFVVGDDGTSGDTGNAVARRLVDEEGIVAIVGAAASGVSRRVNEVARSARIPQISCCSTSDLLIPGSEGGDDIPFEDRFFFRTVSPDGALQAPVLAGLARNRLECDRLAIIHLDDTYGAPFGVTLERKFTQLGGMVPVNISYSEGEPSYRTQAQMLVDALRDTPMDEHACIALVSYPTDGGIILREFTMLKPAGLTVTFVGGDGVKSLGLVEEAGDAMLVDGMLGTAPFTEQASTSNTRFVEAHRAIWGAYPDAGLFPSAQYDAAAIVLLALAAADPLNGALPTGDAVRDQVYAVSNRAAGEDFFTAGQLGAAIGFIRANPGVGIDYEGASGPCEINDLGFAPTNYEVWRFDRERNAFVTDTVIQASEIEP